MTNNTFDIGSTHTQQLLDTLFLPPLWNVITCTFLLLNISRISFLKGKVWYSKGYATRKSIYNFKLSIISPEASYLWGKQMSFSHKDSEIVNKSKSSESLFFVRRISEYELRRMKIRNSFDRIIKFTL